MSVKAVINVLFVLNILFAGALLFVVLKRDKLRARPIFHLIGVVAGGALFGVMILLSAMTERVETKLPLLFYIHVVVGTLVYAPFLYFLVITYVRAFGLAARGGIEPLDIKLADARDAMQFGHLTRAAKRAHEILEEHENNVEARLLLAEIQLKNGKYEKAIGGYRLAMANARDNAEFARIVFKVAVLLNEDMGDVKGACNELDLIRKRMPGTPEAKKAQDWIVHLIDEAARESEGG